MTRIASLFGVVAVLLGAIGTAGAAERPNILFIMSDDHDQDAAG